MMTGMGFSAKPHNIEDTAGSFTFSRQVTKILVTDAARS